jgi:hypothetical protein
MYGKEFRLLVALMDIEKCIVKYPPQDLGF